MALTAQQVRASLEARKKELLSGGTRTGENPIASEGQETQQHGIVPPSQNTQTEEETRLEVEGGDPNGRQPKSDTATESTAAEVGPEAMRLSARGKSPAPQSDLGISRPGTVAPRGTSVPQAPEIELAVLSALYQYPSTCFPIFNERARADFFFSPVNRSFLYLLSDYFNEHGQADPASFLQSLLDSGQLEKHGGTAFLSQLLTSTSPPSALEYHLEILRDKFVAREAFRISNELAASIGKASESELWPLITEHEAAIAALRRLEGDTRGRLPNFNDLAKMLNGQKPPRPTELITGLLHQGSKLIVGGTSKGRKTFSLIDLALSVATGTPWWGFPTAQGPVCYINFEIQESFFCERAETICQAKQISLPDNTLMAWNLRGHSEGIENLAEEIVAKLLTRSFVLVIVDPIYKALGNRDENKAGDVASLCNQLERVAVKTGAAVAFGAHYSKGNQAMKESIDRIGGSGVFARDPDSILTMTAHEEEDAFTVDATLRNFKPLDPFVLKWNWPVFFRTDLDPLDLKRPKNRNSGQFAAKYSKGALLSNLSVIDGIKPATLFHQLAELEGISRAQFYRLASELRADGSLIEKDRLWFKK